MLKTLAALQPNFKFTSFFGAFAPKGCALGE